MAVIPKGYLLDPMLYNIFSCDIPIPASDGLRLSNTDVVFLAFPDLLLRRSIDLQMSSFDTLLDSA